MANYKHEHCQSWVPEVLYLRARVLGLRHYLETDFKRDFGIDKKDVGNIKGRLSLSTEPPVEAAMDVSTVV